jgi:hypothetical protein
MQKIKKDRSFPLFALRLADAAVQAETDKRFRREVGRKRQQSHDGIDQASEYVPKIDSGNQFAR